MKVGITLVVVLTRDDLTDNPMVLFNQWYQHAEDEPAILDANKMCVSTVDHNGYPDTRWVLMKYHDTDLIRFYTNYNSTKGKQIEARPKVALNFIFSYADYFRQIRIKGEVKKTDPGVADAYFASRSRMSQLGAWASDQSTPLTSRSELEQRLEYYKEKFRDQEVPRPSHWSGYDVYPVEMEFWQTGNHRLHDRFLYILDEGNWEITRLFP